MANSVKLIYTLEILTMSVRLYSNALQGSVIMRELMDLTKINLTIQQQEELALVAAQYALKATKHTFIYHKCINKPWSEVQIGDDAQTTIQRIKSNVTRGLFNYEAPRTHKQTGCRVHKIFKARPIASDKTRKDIETLLFSAAQKLIINEKGA